MQQLRYLCHYHASKIYDMQQRSQITTNETVMVIVSANLVVSVGLGFSVVKFTALGI